MKKKIKKPKCFKDDRFIYCYCGKCKPENYPMPKDLLNYIKNINNKTLN